MTDLIPAELLEKGAAYIEEHGLWQGAYWPHFDSRSLSENLDRATREGLPACASGALAIAAGGFDDGGWDASLGALGDYLGVHPPYFNDTPGRTAAEVADAMRACATNLRGA